MRDDRGGGTVGKIPDHLNGPMTVEGREIRFGSVTLDDLKSPGSDLRLVALTKFRNQAMVPFDQGDASRGRFEDMCRESPHAGTDFHKMITRPRLQSRNDRTCQIRIQKEVLTQHFAGPYPDLIKAGAEFGFRHGNIHKALKRLVPAVM